MRLSDAARQAWPPFVLVTGLLLVGLAAHTDHLFERIGGSLERLPGGPTVLFVVSALVVAVVTAVLNLDTAVVFLTPVVVIAARRGGVCEQPFLYAAVFMANASSLYLPGSNLTNLLVLSRDPVSGGTFAARLLAPALAATMVTAVGLWVLSRSQLRHGNQTATAPSPPPPREWTGLVATRSRCRTDRRGDLGRAWAPGAEGGSARGGPGRSAELVRGQRIARRARSDLKRARAAGRRS